MPELPPRLPPFTFSFSLTFSLTLALPYHRFAGYAAVRAAIALRADAALAFAPQVAIDPKMRAERRLPPAPFDGLLTGLG